MTTPIISTTELRDLLPQKPLILDCRFDLFHPEQGRIDYHESHIPGACYLHLNEDLSGEIVPGKTGRHPLPDAAVFLAGLIGLGLTFDRPTVVYDDKGGGIAARAWWMLKSLGYDGVSVLDGGFPAWLAAELPTRSGTEKEDGPVPATVALREFAGTRDRARVSKLRNDPAYALIDSRTADRYRGENENIDPVAGCIAGAINLPWPENLENGKFKSGEALRERFAGLKKKPRQNVFYCGSGVTACHNVLAFYYAFGELPDLYPGSWSEYLLGLE